MQFRPLPPDVIWALLQGHSNEIGPLQESRHHKAKSYPCPRCGGPMHAQLRAQPFGTDDPLPRQLLQCVDCEHTVDELSGIVVKTGNVGKIEDPFKINTDD